MLSEDDKWFAVSLRFMGTGFDPRDVESRIGLTPTSMRVIGEKWTGKTGREYGPAKNSVWSHRLEVADDVGFELQIRTLLDRIAAHSDAVRMLAGTDQVEAELFCGFGSGNGQGGDIISADTLGQIAALGLALSLDLYPPDIDEHPEESESEQVLAPNRSLAPTLNSTSSVRGSEDFYRLAENIMTTIIRVAVAILISLSFAHAEWIGEFPGLSKLVIEADAIIILRVDKSDGDFGGMDLYSTHDCYVYQTLKGDVPTNKVIRLKLMDARSSIVSPFAHHSTMLAFLTKKRTPNEPTDYRSLEIKGATIRLPPTGQETAPKGDTIIDKVRWVLQRAIEFNAKEHEKEKVFLQQMVKDEAKPK